jgi:hypothetical protein
MAKAEQADSTPLQEGLSIPEEITRRQERKAALAKARVEIEARPKRATPSSWPSMRRNWRSGPPKKNGVMVCAAAANILNRATTHKQPWKWTDA